MKSKRSTKETRHNDEGHPGFTPVVNAFSEDKQATRGEGKGFGSGALKVNGKIFAMVTSKHKLDVKLPKSRSWCAPMWVRISLLGQAD